MGTVDRRGRGAAVDLLVSMVTGEAGGHVGGFLVEFVVTLAQTADVVHSAEIFI